MKFPIWRTRELKRQYNPDQPRDADGKFGSGGGDSGGHKAAAGAARKAAASHRKAASDYINAEKGIESEDKAQGSMDQAKKDTDEAIGHAAGSDNKMIAAARESADNATTTARDSNAPDGERPDHASPMANQSAARHLDQAAREHERVADGRTATPTEQGAEDTATLANQRVDDMISEGNDSHEIQSAHDHAEKMNAYAEGVHSVANNMASNPGGASPKELTEMSQQAHESMAKLGASIESNSPTKENDAVKAHSDLQKLNSAMAGKSKVFDGNKELKQNLGLISEEHENIQEKVDYTQNSTFHDVMNKLSDQHDNMKIISHVARRNVRRLQPDGKPLYRSAKIDKSTLDREARTVDMSIASENVVDRGGYKEILDHSPKSIRLKRMNAGGAFLDNHDTSKQIGGVVPGSARIEGKKLRCTMKFSRSQAGEDAMNDVDDGIRTLASVGYNVHAAVTESTKDGVETVRCTDWEPLEGSLVPIPADETVGVGRSSELNPTTQTAENNTPMKKRNLLLDPLPAGGGGGGTATVDVVKERNQARTDERLRVTEIRAIAKRAKVPDDIIEKAINEDWPVDKLRQHAIESMYPNLTPVVDNNPDIGMNDKEKRSYSIVRAMRCLANKKPLDGLEKEASDAVAKRTRREAEGFFIPNDVTKMQMREFSGGRDVRALNAEVATAGGYTIQETVLGDNMIEILRNEMFVSQMGATNLSGLVGDIAIPRQSGAATAYWLGESDITPESDQALGQLALRPRRLAALTAYTKQLLAQSSIGVELFVRADLMAILALAKDYAAINGPGGASPLGIVNTVGVGSNTWGGAATWANVVALETAVAQANALRGRIGLLTSPGVRGKWKSIQKAGSTTGNFLWGNMVGDDKVNGYPANATNQIQNNQTIFGNWSDLVMADWDGIDVVVDPYTLAAAQQIRIVICLMTDVGVRHPVSFIVSSDSGAQ